MKRITFRAEEAVIARARKKAAAENTTLTELFRGWLAEYAGTAPPTRDELERIAASFGDFRLGRRVTREERNERR